MTESDAVSILLAYNILPSSTLKSLRLYKGTLIWINDDTTSTDTTDKKKKDDNKKQQLPLLTDISLLVLILLPLLQRRSSFAPQLLTDAVRRMKPQYAILLLRLFMMMMKGLSSSSLSSLSSLSIELEGRQILRCIDWTEAIIDAHFPAITINYHSDPTNYQKFLTVAPGAEVASSSLEKILGICHHIEKISDIPVHQHIVQKSLYLVESLSI